MGSDRWERTTFGALIAEKALEIGDGYRAKNDELGGDGLIFLRAGHVTETRIDFSGVERFFVRDEGRLRSKVAKPGDAVVTTKGNSTGRTAFVTKQMPPFVYSPHLSYWRSRNADRVEGGFLRYWSRGAEFGDQLEGMMTSTDMAPYLSLVDQRRLRITLPPIEAQRAIAHILGSLDDKIDLNRRMAETLEAMARALFKSWFVDFDPVRAKAAGRDTGLAKDLADLFPNRFVDSEIGEIPHGWRPGTLADLSDVNPESWNRRTRPTTINYIDLANVKWGRIESIAHYDSLDAPSRAQRVLQPGDTVVGTVRPGNGSYAFVLAPGLTGSTGFAVLRPSNPDTAEFVYLAATSRERIEVLQHLADGGAYPAVSPESVAATPVAIANVEVFQRFASLVAPMLRRVFAAESESRALGTMREALLPKLISGEIRVPAKGRSHSTVEATA